MSFENLAIFALALHIITVLRLVVNALKRFSTQKRDSFRTSFLRLLTGKIEYVLGPFRDRFLPVILTGVGLYFLIFDRASLNNPICTALYILAFDLLALWNNKTRLKLRLQMAELARMHSNIHPQDFFNQYYMRLGIAPARELSTGFRQLDWQNADFRKGRKAKLVLSPMLTAAISTNTLARLAILAFKKKGAELGRDSFDGLARIWSTRLTQLFHCRLYTEGSENIPSLVGKTLVILNHNSYLDFALNFFAMGGIRYQNGRQLRLRFIAAKDHFVDNPVIYSWISLGKVIENAGMILINRRKKGEGWKAMQEAAHKLVETEVEVAVYPQGTRAHLLASSTGARWDSGYYTSFNAKSKNLEGHLKPGTAHLILDSLLQLKKTSHTHLNILAAGIIGAGTVAPKGKLRLQSETEICFSLPPLWQLSTDFVNGVEVPTAKEPQTPGEELYFKKIDEIQNLIDAKLLQALNWHERLLNFLQNEMQVFGFSKVEVEKISHFCRNQEKALEKLVFMTLERILCLEISLRKNYLQQFLAWAQEDKSDLSLWKERIRQVSQAMVPKQK